MLSKQVKQRIARNKDNRYTPKWRGAMRDFLMSQMPSAQAMLSCKHMPAETANALAAGYRFKANLILERLNTWTRHDWNAFIRSGDADYASYLARRNLYHSMLASREAVKTLAKMPYDPRLAERRKLIEGLTQEQIDRAYRNSPSLNLQTTYRLRRDERVVMDITGDEPRVGILKTTPDPEVLNKDFEGDEINMDLKIDQRNPTLDRGVIVKIVGNEPMPQEGERANLVETERYIKKVLSPFEQAQIEMIQHALKNPDIKWEAGPFIPKKEGE